MIENLTDADKFLYHYTKASTAINFILKNRSLRLSRYTATNDPKETKAWQFDFWTSGKHDLGMYSNPDESAWLSNELKNRANIACFCTDTPPLSGNHLDDIFMRGFCKPRMWAQYADAHRGVCLVFDRKRLSKAIEEQLSRDHLVLSGRVQYVDRSIIPNLHSDKEYTIDVDVLESVGRLSYPEIHLKRHFHRMFFEKMTDWQNESEWRWVVFSKFEEDLFINYGGALIGLIFGEDTNKKSAEDMMALTESWSLRYMGLKWKNSSPWYDYGNFLYIPGLKNLVPR